MGKSLIETKHAAIHWLRRVLDDDNTFTLFCKGLY